MLCCSCKPKLFRLEENGAPVTCQVSTGIALQACIILIHYYGWLVVDKEDPDWIFLQEGILILIPLGWPTQETLTSKSTTHLKNRSVAYLLRGYMALFLT